MHQNHLEILFKKKNQKQTAGPQSETVGVGWDPRICISNIFPGDADACWSGNHTLRTTGLVNLENLRSTSKYTLFFFLFGGVGQI